MAIFDISYVGEMPYLKLTGGTVTGATTFTNNIAASTINGVTVGSNPKFTDTTYSVATTSASGLLPALGGGTTNYLRADGSWATPIGTTYSVATTSANGLMAAADKVAVNKIGSGTLDTTNQTIIPAINELKAAAGDIKVDKFILKPTGTISRQITYPITSSKGLFQIRQGTSTSAFTYYRAKYAFNGTTNTVTPSYGGNSESGINIYKLEPLNGNKIIATEINPPPYNGGSDSLKSNYTYVGYTGSQYNYMGGGIVDSSTVYHYRNNLLFFTHVSSMDEKVVAQFYTGISDTPGINYSLSTRWYGAEDTEIAFYVYYI